MNVGSLQGFNMRILVKLEPSQNLPMRIVWLLLEVLQISTGFHSLQTSANILPNIIQLFIIYSWFHGLKLRRQLSRWIS